MKNLSLNAKIAGVLSIFIVAAIVVAFLGLTRMSQINNALDQIVSTYHARVMHAMIVRDYQRQMAISEAAIIHENDKDKILAEAQKIKDNHSKIEKELATWNTIASDFAKAKFKDYNSLMQEWLSDLDKEENFSEQGNEKASTELAATKSAKVRAAMNSITDTLVEANTKSMDEAAVHANETYQAARLTVLTTSIAAIVAGLFLAWIILKAIGRSIDQVIANLDDSSSEVSSASQQVASAATQLSQATTEQAASLEQTSSALEELNSMLQKNADNSAKSSTSATSSRDSAVKGKKIVENMIEAIQGISSSNNDIMTQINDSNQQISEIVKVILEIGNKTKVINDIVFQTKLLSFNASVEAARAGEHGKGFAVVAEEVGNLAQMSGNAAKEISDLLEGSIQKVERIVSETKTKVEHLVAGGKAKVETGTEVAQQCGEVLEEIVTSISAVTTMVDEISLACKEQAQGIREITKAIGQMDQVTQENASTSEEAAGSAEELSAQAETLKRVVGVLIQTIKGGAGSNNAVLERTNSMKAKEIKPISQNSNSKILHLKNKVTSAPKATAGDGVEPIKKASGFDDAPAPNDPRFEDV